MAQGKPAMFAWICHLACLECKPWMYRKAAGSAWGSPPQQAQVSTCCHLGCSALLLAPVLLQGEGSAPGCSCCSQLLTAHGLALLTSLPTALL